MANSITLTNLNAIKFVGGTSRYAKSDVIYYSDNNLITFETYKRQASSIKPDDKYMEIKKGFEYRPDLVSQSVYSTPNFWWKLLEANNMKDIFEFKAGRTIRIPSSSTILT